MKEPISNFDFEAAFKALDELEIPTVEGLNANRLNLKENLNRQLKTDLLIEDYYDISNTADLESAQGDREAEVAKAKLARIEKIVDLNAETAEDLLTSYVGKFIIQCPQCMTLFYKDEEDIEKSENADDVVNIAETCQHCGNDTGYTLIGKVGEVTPEEASNYEEAENAEDAGEEPAEEPAEETNDESDAETETTEEESEETNLDLDLDLDLDTEEPVEESVNRSALLKAMEKTNELKTDFESTNLTLNESSDAEKVGKNFATYVQDLADTTGELSDKDTEADLAALSTMDKKDEEINEDLTLLEKDLGFFGNLKTQSTEGKVNWLIKNAKQTYYKKIKTGKKETLCQMSVNLKGSSEKDIYTQEVKELSGKIPTSDNFFADSGNIVLVLYSNTNKKQDIARVCKSSLEVDLDPKVWPVQTAIKKTFAEAVKAAKTFLVSEDAGIASIYVVRNVEGSSRIHRTLMQANGRTRDKAILAARYIKGQTTEDPVVKKAFDEIFNRFVQIETKLDEFAEQTLKTNKINSKAKAAGNTTSNSDNALKDLPTYATIFSEIGSSYHIDYEKTSGTFPLVNDAPHYVEGYENNLETALTIITKDLLQDKDIIGAQLLLISENKTKRHELPIFEIKNHKKVANNLSAIADDIEDNGTESEKWVPWELEDSTKPEEEVEETPTEETPTEETPTEEATGEETPAETTDPVTKNFKVVYKAKDIHTGATNEYSFVFKTKEEADSFINERKDPKYNTVEISAAEETDEKVTHAFKDNKLVKGAVEESFKPNSENILIENFETFGDNFDTKVTEYLTETYSNVKAYESTNCSAVKNKLIIEGKINFKSGKTKNTKFEFTLTESDSLGLTLIGKNNSLSADPEAFGINCKVINNTLITEDFQYYYKIGATLIESCNK